MLACRKNIRLPLTSLVFDCGQQIGLVGEERELILTFSTALTLCVELRAVQLWARCAQISQRALTHFWERPKRVEEKILSKKVCFAAARQDGGGFLLIFPFKKYWVFLNSF